MKTLGILVCVLLSLQLSAQTFNAAPNLAMGNTGIAREGVYNLSTNPAGIASVSSATVAAAYQQHFMTADLTSQALFAVVPFRTQSHLGLHLRQYGVRDASNLTTIGATLTRTFGRQIRTSITANWHHYAVRQYLSEQGLSVDLGFQYMLGPVVVGALFRNISGTAFSNEVDDQRIPQELAFGATYRLSGEVYVSADYVHDTAGQYDVRAGVEYRFDKRFMIRGGASSHPVQYHAGAGLLIRQFQVDFASSFHPQLGTSPQVALRYAF